MNTGENARHIIDAVGRSELKAVWDPGNSHVSGGVAYPDGYEAVKPHVVHLHVKDAAVVDPATGLTKWECIGAGEVDYVGQMRALINGGYEGTVSLETHWAHESGSKEEASRRSFEGLRTAIEAASQGD